MSQISNQHGDEPLFHIVLINPEIPQNTGNIGRLSLGVGARLHLVKPLGFDISEKAVRRAGLDYWKSVDLQVHENTDDFLEWVKGKDCHLFSTKASQSFAKSNVQRGSVLIFGAETKGVSEEIHKLFPSVYIPMAKTIRSYNLSNSVAIASYFASSQINPEWMTSSQNKT
jgi:tRNA (cytidine/uridine-2'-O-)-methyltransferase